ncbi:helix-turn-helix transcriptional regulator [Rhodobacteraceae bacterium DSL-40]|uniref:AraC family transcriptional regulator n=1 Tax=Amaricoccus sp. B4 TaxID=3368557 RepID=UPI000DAD26E3
MTKDVEIRTVAVEGLPLPSPRGFLEDPRRPVIAWVGRAERGFAIAPHSHPRAQLALCYDGLMRLQVGEDVWFVPERHGIWIPPGMMHQLVAQTEILVHHLYVDARHAARSGLPERPVVVRATPLLRGIAGRLAGAEGARLSAAAARRLAWVAFDEMARLEQPDLRLPGGRDRRLVAAMDALLAPGGARLGLPEVARHVGVGERTLARLFAAETGLGFRAWRSRMRFMLALEGLELGESSAALSVRLGYSTPSAFIAAFHKAFGAPPSAFRRG